MIGATALLGLAVGMLLLIAKALWLFRFSRKLIKDGHSASWPIYTYSAGILMTLPFWIMAHLLNATELAFLPASWVDPIGFITWTLMVPAFGFLVLGWPLIILWLVLLSSYMTNRTGDAS